MHIRASQPLARTAALFVAISFAISGGLSDPARVTDMQVRSSDRLECQLSAMRGKVPLASGTKTAADPCGKRGTLPIFTGDDLKK